MSKSNKVKYFIESAKCGVASVDGAMSCGPDMPPVIGEIEVRTDRNEKFFLSFAEVFGIPNFFKTEKSTYDLQINMEIDELDEDEYNEFQESEVAGGDYEAVFADPDNELYQLFRYLIYLVTSGWEECIEFQKKTVGKWLDEIEIPVSEIEEEYLEEAEYDADDEEDDYDDEDVEDNEDF